MREKQQKQMPLIEPASGHPQEMELEVISLFIDNTPTICEYVLQDLNEGKVVKRQTGVFSHKYAAGRTLEDNARQPASRQSRPV